jgi:hypothetical protein
MSTRALWWTVKVTDIFAIGVSVVEVDVMSPELLARYTAVGVPALKLEVEPG